MRLGLHVSVLRGPLAAARRARALGAEAFQLLTYRRRPAAAGGDFRWESPDPGEAAAFRAETAGLRVVAHVRYLPFLAAADPARRARSAALLERELRFASLLAAGELVIHLGAYSPGSDAAEGTRLFADGVAEAVRAAGG
ncbi:MAG: TIM barrel protein, partial [Elusimicrobia bacterium]|nr:TIM barrel protein [Elusimicrobiota bacterium]